MKDKLITFVATFLLMVTLPVLLTHAQCTDALTPTEITQGYKFEDKPQLNEEDKKKEPSKTVREFSAARVMVPKDTSFKIILDNEVTAGFAKPNDPIPFTVAENVYLDVTLPGLNNIKVIKRCVAIPKGTKVYGVVDKAKSPYPLYLRGKSRLAVLVQELTLDSSEGIKHEGPLKIGFVEPIIKGRLKNPQKALVRDCRVYLDEKCVVGRRPKLTLPPDLLSPAAEGYIVATGADGTDVLGWVTAFKTLGGLTGLSDLVNPPKAVLNKGMIFDVIVKENQSIWLSVGGSAKKDDK